MERQRPLQEAIYLLLKEEPADQLTESPLAGERGCVSPSKIRPEVSVHIFPYRWEMLVVGNVSVCFYLPMVLVHIYSNRTRRELVGHHMQLSSSISNMSCSLLHSMIKKLIRFIYFSSYLIHNLSSLIIRHLSFIPYLNFFINS